jgi:5-methylcytosine-specific restriction endonuclease McrA
MKTEEQKRKWAAYMKRWRAKTGILSDPEYKKKAAEYSRAYNKTNKAKRNALTALYKLKKRLAIPSWANKEDIKAVYEEAIYMQMQVDHIVPISHPLVCGLHVWDNLQLLTKEENMKKSNSWWPDMPGIA